uniref:RabBD domain-containing protein n=1 Tax=Esox lucius TaxID=8010 RepID=A0A3P8Z2W0_ESOLU
MGRKLDLTGLTDDEAEHVLQVVQRDMRLRKKEEERLSEMKQELDEEGSRCSLLSRQHRFNERCCIRCCSPFTFLLNPRRQCLDCLYNVCKTCRSYSKKDKAWVCSACLKGRLLKTQSLEWYYNNVKCRFKRFGSAKVLKTLYRKHLAEQGTLGELTEGSTYEESIGNEGSVCSDSTFYRQSEEHSMADTLTVALRVAEEAIDEAITKAEEHTDSLDKQNEMKYLLDHREELIGELARTIVQKIIRQKKNLAAINPDYDLDWPPDNQSGDEALASSSPSSQSPGTLSTAGRAKASLWETQKGLEKGAAAGLASWKSVDRLDNSSASSVLKSPDGNWIALQSTQLSRPSLLTKRKSLLFSVLERESCAISAYDEMGSDEPEGSEGPWGAALLEIRRKLTSNTNRRSEAPGGQVSSDPNPIVPSPGQHATTDIQSEPEARGGLVEGPRPKAKKPLFSFLKRKVAEEHRHGPSTRRSSRPGLFDVNFNPEGAGLKAESSEADELEEAGSVRRSRRKRRSKKEHEEEYSNVLLDALVKKRSVKKTSPSSTVTPDAQKSDDGLTSGALTPEPCGLDGEAPEGQGRGSAPLEQELTSRLKELARQSRLSSSDDELDRPEEDQRGSRGRIEGDQDEEMLWQMEMEGGRDRSHSEGEMAEMREAGGGGDMKLTLITLASQIRCTEFSSTEDELDRAGKEEEEWEERGDRAEESEEDREGDREELTARLCRLAGQVSQFSSTEDELDQMGLSDGETYQNSEGMDGEEELTSKLCRLASQVSATQFSSTEDELDRVGLDDDDEMEGEGDEGGGEREEVDPRALWEMEGDEEKQTFKLRDLASLVSASQFSSTEDELDRVGEEEGEREEEETAERSEEDRRELPYGREEFVGDSGGEIRDMWNGRRWGAIEGERSGEMEGERRGEIKGERGEMEGERRWRETEGERRWGEMEGERRWGEMEGERRWGEMEGERRWGEMEGERKWGEMEGERRWGEVEMVRKKDWYLGVVMTTEGRMLSEERKDSIGELDARLFDFDDESDREELPYEATNQEAATEVQTMTENTFTGGGEENGGPEEAKRKTEGGVGDGAVGGQERERSDSMDTLEGEEAFDNVISGLVNALVGIDTETEAETEAEMEAETEAETDGVRRMGEVEVEMNEEMVMEDRERDKNSIKAVETGLNEEEFIDELLLDKMLMLWPLSDPRGSLDKTRLKPEEKTGGKEEDEDAEAEREMNTFGNTVYVVEKGRENSGEEEELTEKETHRSPVPENLDERVEKVSEQTTSQTLEELEEGPRERLEGVYKAREVTGQTSQNESKVLVEREDENNTDGEEKGSEDDSVKEPGDSTPCVQKEILSPLEIQN